MARPRRTRSVTSTSPPRHGFRGVLVEGWNVGWDGDWFANGWDFDFTQADAGLRPGGARRVREVEGRAPDRPPRDRRRRSAITSGRWARRSTLYRAPGHRRGEDRLRLPTPARSSARTRADGPVHSRMARRPVAVRHHLRVVPEAAKHHIAINAHEPIKDTGLRRTYPNWVAREGARGMEYNAWGNPPNPPEHEANLVFTRMLGGPMDFTPGVLSLTGAQRPDDPEHARQAAGVVRGAVQPDPDGGGPAGELREAHGCVPVHQGRAGRLVADARAQRRGGRLRDHRAQGPQRRGLVRGQRDR